MALNDQHTNSRVGLRLIDGLCHGGVHIACDGVLFVEAIEGDGHHTAIEVGQDV
jgi:diaminopimelate epimerase